jgi:RNA polymerase sigma-70 factor (ECF subfamily)
MKIIDPALLSELLDRHARALILFARQWCLHAEDAVQESFVKLAAQRKAPDHPLPWLFQVVRRGAISQQRSEMRRQRHESAAAERSPAWFSAEPGTRLDADAATAALQSLPLQQREIIVAHLWGGLTFAEIAELTGIPSSSAHRLYLAGLSELGKALGEPCNPNPNTTRH